MHGGDRGATTGMEKEKSVALITALREAHQKRHRLLVVLSGSYAWCKNVAMMWYANAKQRVWIGDAAHHEEIISAAKAKQMLGREYTLAVLDAHAGLSPDCLAAVSGTVVAGGVLVLLTPTWEQWGTTPDADYARLASYPHDWRTLSSHFLLHLRSALEEFCDDSAQFFHWHEGEIVSSELLFTPQTTNKNVAPTVEQQECLNRLLPHCGISVLLANRGCGKSATLGFAAQHWQQENKSVLLVAPSRAAAHNVFSCRV